MPNTCFGQLAIGLADTFVEEKEALKKLLPATFDWVYSSPITRCKMLAEELAYNCPLFFDKRLMELNFGQWEGKCWNDIPQKELDDWMADYVNTSPPEGENLIMLFERVCSFITDLKKTHASKILVVTHAGVIRCFLSYFNKTNLKNIFDHAIGFHEVFRLCS